MAKSDRVDEVKEAIATHLKEVGPFDWEEVQKDFLDIPTSSFWRYAKKAKEQLKKPAAPDISSDLFSPKEGTSELTESPGAPKLTHALHALKHAQRFFDLHADILALRQHALGPDGRITDAQLFAKTVRLRNELLKEELSILAAIGGSDHQAQLHDAIMHAFEKASPEVAEALFNSLREIHNKQQQLVANKP